MEETCPGVSKAFALCFCWRCMGKEKIEQILKDEELECQAWACPKIELYRGIPQKISSFVVVLKNKTLYK
jgi:hypothetical protein